MANLPLRTLHLSTAAEGHQFRCLRSSSLCKPSFVLNSTSSLVQLHLNSKRSVSRLISRAASDQQNSQATDDQRAAELLQNLQTIRARLGPRFVDTLVREDPALLGIPADQLIDGFVTLRDYLDLPDEDVLPMVERSPRLLITDGWTPDAYFQELRIQLGVTRQELARRSSLSEKQQVNRNPFLAALGDALALGAARVRRLPILPSFRKLVDLELDDVEPLLQRTNQLARLFGFNRQQTMALVTFQEALLEMEMDTIERRWEALKGAAARSPCWASQLRGCGEEQLAALLLCGDERYARLERVLAFGVDERLALKLVLMSLEGAFETMMSRATMTVPSQP